MIQRGRPHWNLTRDGLQDPLLVGVSVFRPQKDVGPVVSDASIYVDGLARLRVDDRVVLVDDPFLVPSAVLIPQVDVSPVRTVSSRDIQYLTRMWVGDGTIWRNFPLLVQPPVLFPEVDIRTAVR